jgi:hypothetical protein
VQKVQIAAGLPEQVLFFSFQMVLILVNARFRTLPLDTLQPVIAPEGSLTIST